MHVKKLSDSRIMSAACGDTFIANESTMDMGDESRIESDRHRHMISKMSSRISMPYDCSLSQQSGDDSLSVRAQDSLSRNGKGDHRHDRRDDKWEESDQGSTLGRDGEQDDTFDF